MSWPRRSNEIAIAGRAGKSSSAGKRRYPTEADKPRSAQKCVRGCRGGLGMNPDIRCRGRCRGRGFSLTLDLGPWASGISNYPTHGDTNRQAAQSSVSTLQHVCALGSPSATEADRNRTKPTNASFGGSATLFRTPGCKKSFPQASATVFRCF